jgi:hypothetical protein
MNSWITLVILPGFLSALVSGGAFLLMGKSLLPKVVSFLGPLLVLSIYYLFAIDEFGFWAIGFAFGFCACLMGSTFGMVLVALYRFYLEGNGSPKDQKDS